MMTLTTDDERGEGQRRTHTHTHTHTHMYMKRTRAAGAYQYQTEGHRRWSLFVIHTTLQKINSFRHAFMNSWRSHGDDDELKGRSSLTEARRRQLRC